jgi:tetrahydromethanopterin S-methyltransferase subunit C
MTTRRVTRHEGLGAILFGLGLIALGGYYLLKNAFGFDLPELDGEIIVPIIAIAIGAVVVLRAWDDRQTPPA